MGFIEYFVFGVMQGATEFLPISSSGHIFLMEYLLGGMPDLAFEIGLHGASLLAVVVIFWKRIVVILREMFFGFFRNVSMDQDANENRKFGWHLALATVATVPVALLIESRFEFFLTLKSVGMMLLLTGFFIWGAEKFRPEKERNFTWKVAFLLGLIQGFAVIPGISRSGLTIAFLIWWGIERKKSAEISFLLAIPTIVGALVFAIREYGLLVDFSFEKGLAYFVSFLVALLAIKWMMALVRKNWIWFALYCFVLGGGLLVCVGC